MLIPVTKHFMILPYDRAIDIPIMLVRLFLRFCILIITDVMALQSAIEVTLFYCTKFDTQYYNIIPQQNG